MKTFNTLKIPLASFICLISTETFEASRLPWDVSFFVNTLAPEFQAPVIPALPPNCYNIHDAVYRDDEMDDLVDRDVQKCINFLLEIGDDINELDPDGNSPLNLAVRLQNEAMVRFLVERSADLNHRSSGAYSKGETPISEIVGNDDNEWWGDNYELLEFMIKHGADIDALSVAPS